MFRTQVGFTIVAVSLLSATAQAHFPWIKIDQKQGKQGTVLFYFEHAPKAGDGAYLDPFIERGTFWLTTADGESTKIELNDTKEDKLRWLETELSEASPRCIDLYTKWGVYRYGNTDTLLHYYARNIDARDADDVTALAESKHLKLQLQPQLSSGELTVRVTWEGKPLAKQQINLRSPTVAKNFTTNEDGIAVLPLNRPGNYALRTKVVKKKSGEFLGKDYAEVHHHSTLLMYIFKQYAAE